MYFDGGRKAKFYSIRETVGKKLKGPFRSLKTPLPVVVCFTRNLRLVSEQRIIIILTKWTATLTYFARVAVVTYS